MHVVDHQGLEKSEAVDLRVPACVLVVSGLPGSGKSVTARAVTARLSRAAHVEADLLHDMVKQGRAWPKGGERPQLGDGFDLQLSMRLEQACLLARSFVSNGFTAIVDDIVIGNRLGQLIENLQGVDTRFVMLSPDYEVVKARWRAIDSPFVDTWDWIEEERLQTDRVGLWLDSTTMTIDDVAKEILNRLDEAIIPT